MMTEDERTIAYLARKLAEAESRLEAAHQRLDYLADEAEAAQQRREEEYRKRRPARVPNRVEAIKLLRAAVPGGMGLRDCKRLVEAIGHHLGADFETFDPMMTAEEAFELRLTLERAVRSQPSDPV